MAQALEEVIERLRNDMGDYIQYINVLHDSECNDCLLIVTAGHYVDAMAIRENGTVVLILKVPVKSHGKLLRMSINFMLGPHGLDIAVLGGKRQIDNSIKLKFNSLHYEDDLLRIRFVVP